MITVYSKPKCVQCNATVKWLNERHVEFTVVDASQSLRATEYIKSLGYLQAPVVVTDDDHWSGFRPDKLAEVLV